MRLALFEPDIPQNTGALLRLAACFGVAVDLIEPFGFLFDDRRVRRAALDYVAQVAMRRHESWTAFAAARDPASRLVLLTTGGDVPLHDFAFAAGDTLLLGRESAGVPDFVHEAAAARVVIPLQPGARSLNVAMAGAIALYEALRQTGQLPGAPDGLSLTRPRGRLISRRPNRRPRRRFIDSTGARGGIGRRARFRSVFRKEWWFELHSGAPFDRLLFRSSHFPYDLQQAASEAAAGTSGGMMDWSNLRRNWEPRLLSVLRIMAGLLFLQHGLNKFFGFPPTANGSHAAYQLLTLVPGLAGIIETGGGMLIALGLFTRPVAFIVSGEMAAAYFMSHAPRGFFPLTNGGDAAVLYCFVFLYLFAAGAGPWSLDRLRASR